MADGRNPILNPLALLLCALSLSVGWGVRGNWGHEFGAMIPGALTALAACLLSGREDWRRRAAHFAFFGALGWSFGGSISYMQVIGYTQSGHFPSQIYGFACLWVIGFCWGSMGGAGTALPALLDREKLTGFYAPLIAIFIAWFLQDLLPGVTFSTGSQERFDADLNWFDTDWIAATVALPALAIAMAIRRRAPAGWAGIAFMLAAIVCGFLVFDYRFENAIVPGRLAALVILPAIFAFAFFSRPWNFAESLLLWMALGWWVGFLLLVNVLALRMTPPRGDNWAGCLGMAIAMILCFAVHRKPGAVWASIVAGIVGGLGFSGAQIFKLAEISYFEVGKGYHTNWHSILEQTYGFINGLGIAIAMAALATRAPKLVDADSPEPPARPWTDGFAFAFVMIFVTFVNMTKNVESAWVPAKVVPAEFYGQSSQWWFNLAFAILAVTILGAMSLNTRRPLAILPRSALGRGQLFYLAFLWWIVFANASRDFPFAPQRIVTEGVIHLNACLCTLLILGLPREGAEPAIEPKPALSRLALLALAIGLAVSAGAVALQTAGARSLFGGERMPGANLHIRFGPNATLDKR